MDKLSEAVDYFLRGEYDKILDKSEKEHYDYKTNDIILQNIKMNQSKQIEKQVIIDDGDFEIAEAVSDELWRLEPSVPKAEYKKPKEVAP